LSATALAHRLEARNFKTRAFGCRTGNKHSRQKFAASAILNILRNPLYAGYFLRNGELLKSEVEPLVPLEQWRRVQRIILARTPRLSDPLPNYLVGILHDEIGRRMVAGKGGRPTQCRYYASEHVGWARGYGVNRVHVRAQDAEQLALSMIQSFFADRARLRETVLSLGLYSKQVACALRRGQLAARRILLMDREQLREFMLAVVFRADVNRTHLRLLLCSFEVYRFLAWDGVGLFRKAQISHKGADRFRMLYAPACLIGTKPEFAAPVKASDNPNPQPDPGLVDILTRANELRQFMLDNRSKSIAQLASEKKLGSKYFARLLRLNYLAPDIQAAIIDGSQPPDLTRNKLVFSSLPLDWEHQRRLFGFPSPIVIDRADAADPLRAGDNAFSKNQAFTLA